VTNIQLPINKTLKHTELALNDRVVCDRYSAAIDLRKATLVDQFTQALQVWISGRKLKHEAQPAPRQLMFR